MKKIVLVTVLVLIVLAFFGWNYFNEGNFSNQNNNTNKSSSDYFSFDDTLNKSLDLWNEKSVNMTDFNYDANELFAFSFEDLTSLKSSFIELLNSKFNKAEEDKSKLFIKINILLISLTVNAKKMLSLSSDLIKAIDSGTYCSSNLIDAVISAEKKRVDSLSLLDSKVKEFNSNYPSEAKKTGLINKDYSPDEAITNLNNLKASLSDLNTSCGEANE